LDHGFLFGGEADLFGASAGIAESQDPDQVSGSIRADGAAGARRMRRWSKELVGQGALRIRGDGP
jgi:hypothetical protein